jgi:hypothetical protein
MKIKLVAALACAALALLMRLTVFTSSADRLSAATPPDAAPAAAATPAVLVELFTSEGCSSCPPADKLLADLDQAQSLKGVQVIALSEHVDYWNRLGWKDPFSSADFSQRQLDYARAMGQDDVYTPQMVIDGRTAFVGSRAEPVRDAIAKAAALPKADVGLAIKAATAKVIKITLQVENAPPVSPGDSADVMLAITESGLLSNVLRGENSGRKLTHAAVTRRLIRVGAIKDKTFSAESNVNLDAAWKRQNMKAVAFVQERASRRVLGAAAISLAGE